MCYVTVTSESVPAVLSCASITKRRCISSSVSLWSLLPTQQMNVEVFNLLAPEFYI